MDKSSTSPPQKKISQLHYHLYGSGTNCSFTLYVTKTCPNQVGPVLMAIHINQAQVAVELPANIMER